MPVEIMAAAALVSLPSRQDLLLGRTVLVPLLVLMALKPRARNPAALGSPTLRGAAAQVRTGQGPHQVQPGRPFSAPSTGVLRRVEPLFGKARRRASMCANSHRASQREEGLGAIFPPWPIP